MKNMKNNEKEKQKMTINNSNENFIKKEWNKELKLKEFSKTELINELTEHELNTLDYKSALEKDKRTYFQYYWSLIKRKNIILFTFMPMKDYNLISVKLSLFLISFTLYLTINAFFFNDDIMHKIYENHGNLDVLNNVIILLFSTFICSIINFIMKLLSLSEKNILELKHLKNFKYALFKSKSIKKCLRIKYIVFYIINYLLLSFFWYFISSFCVVYNNTQKILLKDTIISYGISMLYPFGFYLIPGILRLPALKTKNKNLGLLYKISQYIAYL
jgi:hypothetical protein